MLTVEEVKQALPKTLKSAATQALTDKINNSVADPDVAQSIRENFITYTSILTEGRYKIEDYLNAVNYVTYKLMGLTNQESWRRTFPQRYQRLVAEGVDDKGISAYVAGYHKNKLVTALLEQTLIPVWIVNQDAVQKAVNTLVHEMEHAPSAKVRVDAANAVLTHVKKPETKQVEVNLGAKDPEGMSELNAMLTSLAQQQKQLIESGVSTQKIAHQAFGKGLDLEAKPHHTKAEPEEATWKDITPKEDAIDPKHPLTSFKP